jgi:hypothetical protein
LRHGLTYSHSGALLGLQCLGPPLKIRRERIVSCEMTARNRRGRIISSARDRLKATAVSGRLFNLLLYMSGNK